MDMKVNFVSMKDFVEINNEISSIVLLCYFEDSLTYGK